MQHNVNPATDRCVVCGRNAFWRERIAECDGPIRLSIEPVVETSAAPLCQLCGEPMPKGEEMFNYHGYSGPCPKPPLPKVAPSETGTPLEKVGKVVKAAVALAIVRSNLQPEGDDDFDATGIPAIAEDAWNACQGIDTCSDGPIAELTEALAAQPDQRDAERLKGVLQCAENEITVLKSHKARLREALEKILSPAMDWTDAEIGVGHKFRELGRAALAETNLAPSGQPTETKA